MKEKESWDVFNALVAITPSNLTEKQASELIGTEPSSLYSLRRSKLLNPSRDFGSGALSYSPRETIKAYALIKLVEEGIRPQYIRSSITGLNYIPNIINDYKKDYRDRVNQFILNNLGNQ